MRGHLNIEVADDNSLIVRTLAPYPTNHKGKTVTFAPKDYVGLCSLVETQTKHFQKQPVVDITKG